MRPKWTELYAARRRQRNAASRLPELPDTLFGWIPVLHRITEEEVLQSAGLDAYVVCLGFLSIEWAIANGSLWVVLVFLQVCDPVSLGRFHFRSRYNPSFSLQIHW